MNEIELQAKSIEALKLFNNTIVTSRLYPRDAPQVSIAVDRGYKGIKSFLQQHTPLQFSFQDGNLFLCGLPLGKQTLDTFPNLVVYRQLRLLGLSMLTIGMDIDRFAFNQLLTVFTASVEKIKNGGGGSAYTVSLGLASYFPGKEDAPEEGTVQGAPSVKTVPRKIMRVRSELVACLFDQDKSPVIQAELQGKMAATDSAIETLGAGVVHILQDIQKKKMIIASPYFPVILKRAEVLIQTGNRNEVVMGLSKFLTESLNNTSLCVLFSQEYSDGFGSSLYDGLLTLLSTETLGGILVLFREQLAKAKQIDGENSPQVHFLSKSMLRLINTEKGKHFCNAENARASILKGEETRKRQRLEAGIHGLLQGKITLLESVELVEHLPDTVGTMLSSNSIADISKILHGMAAYLTTGNEVAQEELQESAITIGENLITNGHWNLVDILLEPLMGKVQKALSGDRLLEKTVILLHKVMQHSWHSGENGRGDSLLTLFHQIRSGQMVKPLSVSSIIGNVQDKGIQRATLPELLSQCLAAPNNETLSYRLILQGPVAVRFLVDRLINTESASDRIKIIDLLTYGAAFLPAVIQERLPEHMPWYGKRNLIKLLGETGKEGDAESVLPYFRHYDFRVQREAFLCIYKIGGENRRRMLLAVLDESSELIKIQIVAALENFCDEEVAMQVSDLLSDHEHFSDTNRNNLLLQCLDTLGRCHCVASQRGVQAFLKTRGQRGTRKIPEKIWAGAEKALKFVEGELLENRKKHMQASQFRKNALKQVANRGKGPLAPRVITGLPQEQTIRNLLAKGDKATAGQQVLQLIERTARLRNFIQAEKLREWLLEIDSTAFNLIIRAAEIIDREKAAAIDRSHLEIWSQLYDILSTEEFSAVYHSLTHRKFTSEEVIVNQGASLSSLYFINSGKVKLYFQNQGQELLVKTMESGEIFGADAFFEASVWTISVASIGLSEISVLKLDKLKRCDEDFPGLEAKLHDFCKQFERIEEFIKQTAKERRLYERHKISGIIETTLLDNKGRSTGMHSRGELSDISEGGMCYLVKISQKENARLLLGRKVEAILAAGKKPGDVTRVAGDVLAVKNNYGIDRDYSVHVRFDRSIGKIQLQEILGTALRD